jgi:uncharacterized protein GlcG (DUF336 family)
MKATSKTLRLSAEAALTAVHAAVRHGRTLGVAVNACVVDSGANRIAFLRDDGAFLPSGDIAFDKAKTSAGFGLPSGKLYDVLKGEPDVLAGIVNRPGVAAFPGGLPIFSGEHLVGAIGVSGASAEQDEACAAAGISALEL